jgi:predicted small integral membrane protein
MRDEQILAYFDGRGTAEFTLRGRDVAQSDRIGAIAFELGYELHETDIVTRGQWRMVYLRNDSPDVRQRAQSTLDRLRAGGPLLSQAWAPGAVPRVLGSPITPVEAAAARRNVTAFETNGSRGLVIFVALLSIGFVALAWVARDSLGGAIALLVMAGLLAVVAALIPRLMRSWYERNQQRVARFSQQRSQQWGPPPPPPPFNGGGQDGSGGSGT